MDLESLHIDESSSRSASGRRLADLRLDRHRRPRSLGGSRDRHARGGGLTSRELLGILRCLRVVRLVGGDVVEVAPAYDYAEITALAASHVLYELISLLALDLGGPAPTR
jgi:hypothetical protein